MVINNPDEFSEKLEIILSFIKEENTDIIASMIYSNIEHNEFEEYANFILGRTHE